MLRKCMSLRRVARFTVDSFVDCKERAHPVTTQLAQAKKQFQRLKNETVNLVEKEKHTYQYDQFVYGSIVEDAVASNCFPEVFVDGVI